MYGDFEYRERRYAFGNHILTLRTRVSITQIELAQYIGVHRRSVQNWETGESYPKADTLQRMIAVFLQRGAFREGNERMEAQTLWDEVAQDGSQALAAFDDIWFDQCLTRSPYT